jgi:uncharacterized protein (DUF1499 family)
MRRRDLSLDNVMTASKRCRRKLMKRMLMMLFLITACLVAGCSGSHLIVKDGENLGLSQCLPLPNCVSSESWLFYNNVTPFTLAVPADRALDVVREVISSLPRTEIVEEHPGYIHAKCTSLVFRFVDNLEVLITADKGIISVRSSSVIGLFDFGVNYRRVENLRRILTEKGIVK